MHYTPLMVFKGTTGKTIAKELANAGDSATLIFFFANMGWRLGWGWMCAHTHETIQGGRLQHTSDWYDGGSVSVTFEMDSDSTVYDFVVYRGAFSGEVVCGFADHQHFARTKQHRSAP